MKEAIVSHWLVLLVAVSNATPSTGKYGGVTYSSKILHVDFYGRYGNQMDSLFAAEAAAMSNLSKVFVHGKLPCNLPKESVLHYDTTGQNTTEKSCGGSHDITSRKVLRMSACTSFWHSKLTLDKRKLLYTTAARKYKCDSAEKDGQCNKTVHLRLGDHFDRVHGHSHLPRFSHSFIFLVHNWTDCIALDDHERAAEVKGAAPEATLLPNDVRRNWCAMQMSKEVQTLYFSSFSWTAAVSGGAVYKQMRCKDEKMQLMWGDTCMKTSRNLSMWT